jgi:putative ABC transport system permease protein
MLTALAILVAAFVATISQSWVNGLVTMLLDNVINYQSAHIRVVSEEYVKRERFMPLEELIYDSDVLIEDILQIEGVDRVEERIRFGLLLGKGDNTTDAMGMGLDLMNTSLEFSDKLIEGELSESGIYIGHGLADKIGVEYGEEILIVSRTSEGGLNGIRMPVNGIFRYNIGMYDDKVFYIGLVDAKRLLKIYEGTTTEIYIFNKDIKDTPRIQAEINELLDDFTISQDYIEQSGGMYEMMQVSNTIMAFFEILVLFLASFVVINTMMMAVFERIKEIGTLKALGMTDRELFFNFTLEGGIIGFLGGTIGVIVGTVLTAVFGVIGIDFSAMSSMDLPFEYIIYPQVYLSDILVAFAISIIIPAVSAMFPARFAKRLMPAEALRK